MGERQPLPRPYLAQLAEFLLESGARVVGFDVQLKKATTPREDGALVAVTRRWAGRTSREVVLPVGDPKRGINRHDAISVGSLRDTVWRIDYVGQPGAFAAFPAGALMAVARSGVRPEGDNPFRGKIVLVGATFGESRDFYGTPMGLMSGVEIQANIVHTLLSRRALLPPPWALNIALLLTACLWISLLSVRMRQVWVIVLSLGLVVVFVAVSYEAYRRGYWLAFIAPPRLVKVFRQGSSTLARRRLNAEFGQYVSKEELHH